MGILSALEGGIDAVIGFNNKYGGAPLRGLKRQMRSVIEWEMPEENKLFELWSENGDEIKNVSKLIVKPGQGVIFVYEGQIKAIHTDAGLYTLKTDNIPFLTTLSKFMQAFESEHKTGIYFFWKTEFLNQKWGTNTPVKYMDPFYKFPVSLRAFGNFSFKITNPELFFTNVVGSKPLYTLENIRETLFERMVEPIADILGTAKYAYLEIDTHREELSSATKEKISVMFDNLGFALTDFRIASTNFDEKTQELIERIASVTAETRAAESAGVNFAHLQQLSALRDAAKNEGGVAGAGVGMGAGIGLGQSMAMGMMNGGMMNGGVMPNTFTPTASEPSAPNPSEKLLVLKKLKDDGLITEEEHEKKKSEILASW